MENNVPTFVLLPPGADARAAFKLLGIEITEVWRRSDRVPGAFEKGQRLTNPKDNPERYATPPR